MKYYFLRFYMFPSSALVLSSVLQQTLETITLNISVTKANISEKYYSSYVGHANFSDTHVCCEIFTLCTS